MRYLRQLTSRAEVWKKGQTYKNLLYLLAAFPLGLCYFVALVVGLSVGFGLAILGVGLLILVITLGLAWTMANVERYLAIHLLHMDIAPMSGSWFPDFTRWQRIWSHLRRPITWKSMAFIILKFPLGLATFVIIVTLLAASLCLLFYPVGMIVSAGGVHRVDIFAPGHLIWQHVPQPLALLLVAALCLLACALGYFLSIASLLVCNVLAFGWGQLSRVLLGMSLTELQLAEARVTVAREQARAEHSDQRRRELIVNVSHELRTPIANIRGHVESLRLPTAEQLSNSDKDRYLAIVARETDRLSSLVDDLLALARSDAHELRLDVKPVPVEEVVAEVFQALAPLAGRERQVTLIRTVTPNLPPALADRDRLAQVLLNLARNAITATPVGGLVFLDLEQADDGHLRLTVSDTGHGIPAEDLDRVFERFYRSDASRQRATGGFGLGLAIVWELVQAMGGTVTATSTEGAGSSFTVLLRVAPVPA